MTAVPPMPRQRAWALLGLVLLALLAGLAFTSSPGTTDVDIWRSWARNADSSGPVIGFRLNQADYPPLATLVLHLGYQVFQRWASSSFPPSS